MTMSTESNTSSPVSVINNSIDWPARWEELHEREWEVRAEVLELVRVILDRWKQDADKIGTLDGVVKLIEATSKLGRLATEGLAEQQAHAAQERGAMPDDFREAIARIFSARGESETAVQEQGEQEKERRP
jgi:hypothetical protein